MPDRKMFFIGSLLILCLVNFASLSAVPDCPVADLTGDCVVNLSDLVIFADHWLTSDSSLHPGLIARWRFDESAGETAVEDFSGHNGILHGDPEWMPLEGFQKGALYLDGVNDYVRVEDSDGLDFGAADDFTVSGWFMTTQTDAPRLLFKNGPDRNGYAFFMAGGRASFRTWSNGVVVYADTDGTYNDGQWHHVTGVRRAGQSLRIYIDGQLQKETAEAGGRDLSNDMPLTMGAEVLNDPDGIFFYHGQMDEVQLHSQALSPDEVLHLYQTGSPQRHSPDFTADDKVDLKDHTYLSTQWNTQAPEVIISEFLASNDSENPPVTSQGEIRDGNGDSSDWIELFNQTDFPVDLAGWSLSDKADEPIQWQFPQDTILEGRSYLIIFASGKEQDDSPGNYPYVDPQGYLHTNFKLSASGEYLSLRRPDGRIEHVYEAVENPDSGQFGFPEQEENISYGVLHGDEYYFALPTPGRSNQQSFLGFAEAPEFSHERGYYSSSFQLTLTTETHGAVIRYTTDGTEPTLSKGQTYTSPLDITMPVWGTSSRCIRAAAFKPGYATSPIKTKTYLLNAGDILKGLPAVCLSGSPTQTFFNPSGIMAIVGGTWDGGVWRKILSTDYNNVLGHGMDYERPVSMEYINPALDVDFQEDCGIRVHGSAWMRPRYTMPSSGQWSGTNKYSFRLYFRGEYGETLMRHSILERFPEVDTMDTVVLRAGHNDQSNPFVRDEMIRRLQYYMGHEASLGTFVNLFINGSYKGYYNLCERIDEGFCQKYYDSSDEWDVVSWVQPDNVLEARDGDMTAFKEYISYARSNNLTDPVHYNEVVKQLDLEGFVDYLIVQCWGGNWDWPQNNWTACAERAPDRKWRFFVWDAEGCMDNDLYRDRFGTLNSDSSDLSRLYQALRVNADFRMLFADRLQKHFLESDSVMRQAYLHSLFKQLADEMAGVIPNINQYIPFTYIPGRESIFFNQCVNQGLFTFRGPDLFLNGRKIDRADAGLDNSLLTFQNASGQNGDIYFTLNGTDPRLPLSQRSSSSTLVPEDAPKRVLIPTGSVNTNWRSNLNFNDSAWNDGLPADGTKTGGVGYEVHSGNEAYISYDVRNAMYNQRTSAYIRIPFTVDAGDMDDWNYLTLSIRYDDAFVAYINGTEVCRRGFSGTPQWNSSASSNHENNGLEVIPINASLSALRPGENLLAIHGLNVSTNSSDFVISPILEAGYSDSGIGISPAAQKFTAAVPLHKSVTVKARTLNGSTWSALRQADIVIGHVNENLRISEVQYHPAADPNEEFIELTNIGSDPINLNKVHFAEGIDYTFGDTVLQPGAFLLLVRNPSVFENKYGAGLPVAGQYVGALDDSGETLKLRDAAGGKIQTLDYGDTWYDITDGDGFSLTAVDPSYEKSNVPQTGLSARWGFDEASGTTLLDTAGQHPGIMVNMQETQRVLGHEHKALYFDGVNDYVRVEDSDDLDFGATDDFTVSGWFKTTQTDAPRLLFKNGPNRNGYAFFMAGGKVSFRTWSNGVVVYADTDGTYNDGQWHHVTGVRRAGQSLRVYIDGQLQKETAEAGGRDLSNDMPLTMGAEVLNDPDGIFFYQGLLDDMRIYERAMSPEEITFLAQDISWSRKALWRPSAIRGGTPGRSETLQEQLPLPGAVVINELLTHSHAGLPDWIELYNTTGEDISIGGWFLSDAYGSDADRKKYQIPAGTVLTPASPYYVIEEGRFNNASDPGCRVPFALSEGGETLYLQSAQGEVLTGYFAKEEFDAAETNVSFGRFEKSTGSWNFVPMSVQTPGAANAYPKVGPVIISEIMYNPGSADGDQDYEYIELMNISTQPVRTAAFVSTYTGPTTHFDEWVPWAFTDGITFTFPVQMELAAGQRILLVEDLAAFNSRYAGVPAGTVVMEWTGGNLANEGEKLQLSTPGDKEYQQDRYYIRHDRVNYDDEGDWSQPADGTGKSLTHLRPDQVNNNYSNDPVNWTAADPTPGW